MPRLALLCCTLAAFSARAMPHQSASPTPAAKGLQTGIVISKITCAAQSGQSYALYLPSRYNRERSWPIVYAFDPAARGGVPVELMKDAAERYGHIVAGSNNSRNGAWEPMVEVARVMFHDTHARLTIDNSRVFFAGFSGGARFAAWLAQTCNCAAGVLLDAAGFTPFSPPTPHATFAVFAAVGTYDFNYGEVVDLNAKLGTLHYSHALCRFDGPHQWAPTKVMDEPLAWFRLIAMKSGREPRDKAFVTAQTVEAENRAQSLVLAGNAYGGWEEYRQAAETFDGLGETQVFRDRAAALEKEKAVRDGAKREQQELEEQARLSADVSSGLAALRQDSSGRAEAELRSHVVGQITRLRDRSERETNPQKVRVMRRALAGIYMEAMEAGQERSGANDFSRACAYFELAAVADPHSVPALRRAQGPPCSVPPLRRPQ